MDSQQNLVKLQTTVDRNHDFAVEHELLGAKLAKRFDQVGKIASERLSGFRLQFDLVVRAKSQAAKSVPLRLILPAVPGWNFIDEGRFHRRGLRGEFNRCECLLL